MKFTLAIDFGASSTKMVFQDQKQELKKVLIINRMDEGNVVGSKGIPITINSKTKFVGSRSGAIKRVSKKIMYEDLEYTIGACCKHIIDEYDLKDKQIELDIKTCLPPNQFWECEELFIEKISKIHINECVINGNTYTIKVNSCSVTMECLAILDAVDISKIVPECANVLIIDIGSSTTDNIFLEWTNEGYEPISGGNVEKACSNMIKSITNGINKELKGESTFKADDLELNQTYQWKNKVTNVIDKANYADNMVKTILADINREVTINQAFVILTGRGKDIFSSTNSFKKAIQEYYALPDDLATFGNAIGAYNGQ